MKRVAAKSIQVVADLLALSVAYAAAFLLRFDWAPPDDMLARLWATLPYVLAVKYGALRLFGVPRFPWRFVGLREVVTIGFALGLASASLIAARLGVGALLAGSPFLKPLVVPLGVLLIDAFLSFFAIVGLRASRRLQGERARHPARATAPRPTLLVGAGRGGLQVIKELRARPDLGLLVKGFVDDDPMKWGQLVHGVPVLGSSKDIPRLAQKLGIRQVLISIATPSGEDVRRVKSLCDDAGLQVKVVPELAEVVRGDFQLSKIRDVAIEDLLRREPVKLEEDAIADLVEGQTVMITGAGGSIGTELCRQVARFRPTKLLLVERSENALFYIHREILERWPAIECVPLLVDVTEERTLRQVFARHRPNTCFHAAAHKHVPMLEWNPGEGIRNNVGGTKVVADLACEHGVSRFVMVSTDKAVRPTSVMGATKRLAEAYIAGLNGKTRTRFMTVRFGNVLGSAGSVVPVFRAQIAAGGPVTVTHPDMRRYFMTIPEACQLVLQAATMGHGGEIFVLDMGEPVRIVDLARDLIELSGLRPEIDVKIEYTGIRPGEKLFEELNLSSEHIAPTSHPKILVGALHGATRGAPEVVTQALLRAARADAPDSLRATLRELIPDYRPSPGDSSAHPSDEAEREPAGNAQPSPLLVA